jgi:xylulokinase
MLPGDYIAMKLTSSITTSVSALSEGILYDFQSNELSKDVTEYFEFNPSLFPEIQPVFSIHGHVTPLVASLLGLRANIPVAYKAGDQPNNALSLNVLQPGEVAATAGTSGVIYGIANTLIYDIKSRVNPFAHVNHTYEETRLGVLMCINGTGSMYRWVKNIYGNGLNYSQMNDLAATAPPGCNGLRVIPFGNGTERMLCNQHIGAHFIGIDVNLHTLAHIFRATQEGIACAFRYGLDIMRENSMKPTVIRAGKANMFLSDVFTQTFVNMTGISVELYKTDGSVGAALGAGIGSNILNESDVEHYVEKLESVYPENEEVFEKVYQDWKMKLEMFLTNA